MDFFIYPAPVPPALDLAISGGVAVIASLLTAVTPAAVIFCHTVKRMRTRHSPPECWTSEADPALGRHLAA